RELTAGACVIDRQRQLVRQYLRQLVDRDVVLGGELLDAVASEHLTQLIGRDRQVLAIADPGFDLIAEAGLLQLGDDRVKPALAAIAENFAQHDRKHGSLELPERALESG